MISLNSTHTFCSSGFAWSSTSETLESPGTNKWQMTKMLWQRKTVARKDMEIERNRLSFSCHFSFSQRQKMKHVIVSSVQHFYLRLSRFFSLKNNQPLVVRDNFYFDLSSTNLWNLMCFYRSPFPGFYFVWESSIFGAIDRCFCRQLHVTELRCSP